MAGARGRRQIHAAGVTRRTLLRRMGYTGAAMALSGSAPAFLGNESAHAEGLILGVSFTGGDGSYKRAVREGLTLGIAPDLPWTYEDPKTKEPGGIDVMIHREVYRRLGITKLSWQIMPFGQLIPAVTARRIDVQADNLYLLPKRAEIIDFTSPAHFYGGGLAVPKGNPKKIHLWEDLKGKTVGANQGSSYQTELEKRNDLKGMKTYPSPEPGFADLIAGRVDVYYTDEITITGFIKAHPGANMELASGFIPQTRNYGRYGVRKDDVDLNWAISRAIDEIRADGTMNQILTAGGESPRSLFWFPVQ